MPKRITVTIDDDTWDFLEKIPSGERNRTINDALREWLKQRRRVDAVMEMSSLSAHLPRVSSADIVRWIREDRDHGH